jgi:hypothetical protein
MTNGEINYANFSLNSPSIAEIKSTKVNYAIEKNKKLMKPELEIVQSLFEKIEGYKKYQSEVTAIKEPELAKYEVKIKEVNEKYPAVILAIDEIWKQKNEGYTPYTVKYDDLPADLSSENMQILFPFITE